MTQLSSAVEDFSGDGKPNPAVRGVFGLAILAGKGDGTRGVLADKLLTYKNSLEAGDFNGDGKLDLAASGGQISLLLGKGDGMSMVQGASFVAGGWLAAGGLQSRRKAGFGVASGSRVAVLTNTTVGGGCSHLGPWYKFEGRRPLS